MTGPEAQSVAAQLRAWAKGMYPIEAAVELATVSRRSRGPVYRSLLVPNSRTTEVRNPRVPGPGVVDCTHHSPTAVSRRQRAIA